MTLLELTTARDDLQKEIYSGLLEVRFGERWLKYQPLPDMRKALADLDAQIANFASNVPRSMCTLARFNG